MLFSLSETVNLQALNIRVDADQFDSVNSTPNSDLIDAKHLPTWCPFIFRVDYDEAGCGYRMNVKAMRYRDNARAALASENLFYMGVRRSGRVGRGCNPLAL